MSVIPCFVLIAGTFAPGGTKGGCGHVYICKSVCVYMYNFEGLLGKLGRTEMTPSIRFSDSR